MIVPPVPIALPHFKSPITQLAHSREKEFGLQQGLQKGFTNALLLGL